FVNGKPDALEVTYSIKSAADWDRFIRFMDRYSTANGLEFSKS
ncbi:MAG: photosystem II reaction center protein Psb28, partial [Synechococcales cyanobacterium]